MVQRMKRLGAYWNKPNHAAYLFLLPALIILLLFIALPLVGTLSLGFFHINIFFANTKFVGFHNFVQFFHDQRALNSFKNTLYFTVLETPVQVFFGLVVAAVLARNSIFNRFFRSIYFIPVVVSLTSASLIWSMLLDPNIGAVPYFFHEIGLPTPHFFRDPVQAMPTVVALTVWHDFGVTMMILVAGIQGISNTYYEAAQIDGANKIQQFFKITVPQVLPSLGFVIITNLIGSLRVFDQVYITTGGGPEFKTETAVQYIYSRGFSAPYQLGYASAISAVLFIVIATLAITTNWYLSKKEREFS